MNHKTHEIELLETAADEERAKILAGVEFMNHKQECCRELILQCEETVANLEANIASAKSQVSQSAKQLIAVIHEREREAITILDNTRVSRMQKLDAVKKQVQQLEKQIKQAAEFASELAQRSSSADIIGNRRNLQERFEELRKTQLPALPASSFLKHVSTFDPDSLSLGFIVYGNTDPKRSTIEGLKQTFQARVEATISIRPKTREGQISNRQHEDHVEVQVEPADQLASWTINKKADGNFQVKFVPKLPGAYQISANINGDSLAQSPFTVVVDKRKLEVDGEFQLTQNETLRKPAGIAVNCNELIAIEGRFTGKTVTKLTGPWGMATMPDGRILVCDFSAGKVIFLK